MREVKFRAWDCITKQYIYVAFIDLVNSEVSGLPFEIQEGQEEMKISTLETLEQFTGLHDKNGKDIYEGDILESKRKYGYMYDTGYRGFVKSCDHYADYEYGMFGGQLTQAKADYCEVIGNIHENMELLSAN